MRFFFPYGWAPTTVHTYISQAEIICLCIWEDWGLFMPPKHPKHPFGSIWVMRCEQCVLVMCNQNFGAERSESKNETKDCLNWATFVSSNCSPSFLFPNKLYIKSAPGQLSHPPAHCGFWVLEGQQPMFSPFETTTFYPAFLPRQELKQIDSSPKKSIRQFGKGNTHRIHVWYIYLHLP